MVLTMSYLRCNVRTCSNNQNDLCIREGIRVDGRPIRPDQREIVLAVNKPAGVVCSTDRRWGDALIGDLIRMPERLFYVGRLDKESEGLILMTNQGRLSDAGLIKAKVKALLAAHQITKTRLIRKETCEGVDVRHALSNSFGFGGSNACLVFSKPE